MTLPKPADLIRDDHDHLIHSLHHPLDHKEPLVFVEGKGIVMKDVTGREYIDGMGGLWNVSVGHGREELAQAAAEQMRSLAYCSTYAGSSNVPAIQLAARLSELAYKNMAAVFFTCGGAESNESAFKTARFYWKAKGKPEKMKIISRHHGYHGVTLQVMSATGIPGYWKMFEPRVPGFVHINPPYAYRYQGARPGETVGQAAARELEEAILREGPDSVAAFIAEPIIGAGGVILPPDDYFPLVKKICSKHQVLFIADEVITGFCRTGHWFALTHWGVEPDIMSFAKGVTSGYLPLGGIMVSREIKEAMDSVPPADKWMHCYTYSGHPVACAVGLKNIEIMVRERLWERAAVMGARLYKGLTALSELKAVGDVRGGKGLMAGVELVADRGTKAPFSPDQKVGERVRQEMIKRGLFTRQIRDIILLAPPLIVSEGEVDRIVEIVSQSIQAVIPGNA
jgi:adenosylmethionine-8-amino-7-oxononanoate aminotransferase